MTVGERIRNRRIELGLSVNQMADLIGVNKTTIYRYESDEIQNMGIEVLKPIAKALRTDPAWLMGWADDPAEGSLEDELQAAFEKNPDMRTLFSVAKDASPADIRTTIKVLESLKSEPK